MVLYTALNLDVAEIRLLELLSGENDTPIRCTLRVASLNDKPKFEALSYVWGDPTVTRSITVDGDDFQATTNLEKGLRELRYRRGIRTLWVDAICINQGDVLEKNRQVPLMSRIYREATQVMAWLGPSVPTMETTISYLVEAYVHKRPTASSLNWIKLRVLSKFSARARDQYDLAILKARDGCQHISGLPYWTRIWTFQEYYLPHDEPVCRCGSLEYQATDVADVQLPLMLEAVRATYRVDWTTCADIGGDLPGSTLKQRTEESGGTLDLVLRFIRNSDSLGGGLSDFQLDTMKRLSSDPRDRVYGLYGVVSPKTQHLLPPPDYSKPVERVYLETMGYFVKHEHPFLGFQFHELAAVVEGSYPSWVLDFASASPLPPGTHLERLPRKDDRFTPLAIDERLRTLSISGRNLGPIHKVATLADTQLDDPRQIRHLLSNVPRPEAHTTCLNHIPGLTVASIARLLFRHPEDGSSSRADLTTAFEDLLANLPEDGPLELNRPNAWRCYGCADGAKELAGETLFLVGHLGLLGVQEWERDVQDEDTLVVATGLDLAFILRSESTGAADGELKYMRMVGVATIGELMRNHPADEDLLETVRHKEVERFHIH